MNETEIRTLFEKVDLCIKESKLDEAKVVYEELISGLEKSHPDRITALYELGIVNLTLDKLEVAKDFWQQALTIFREANDKLSESLLLHNMATLLAQKGNFTEAVRLWHESLKIKEELNDESGIASTILNLAWIEEKENNLIKAYDLNLQASKILSKLGHWNEFIRVLLKLSELKKEKSINFLAQSFYLGVHINVETELLFETTSRLLKELTLEHDFAPLIAATGKILINISSRDLPDSKAIQKAAMEMLLACALARFIPEAEIPNWLFTQGLTDSNTLLSKIDTILYSLVEEWLFEQKLISAF